MDPTLLESNHEEADSRMILHCLQTEAPINIVVVARDRDVLGRESTADFRPAVRPPAHLRGPCGLRRSCADLAGGPLTDRRSDRRLTCGEVAGTLRLACGAQSVTDPLLSDRKVPATSPQAPQGPRNLPASEMQGPRK